MSVLFARIEEYVLLEKKAIFLFRLIIQVKLQDLENCSFYKWAQLGLNQRPIDYESTALTAELWAPALCIVTYHIYVVKRDFINLAASAFFWLSTIQFLPLDRLRRMF